MSAHVRVCSIYVNSFLTNVQEKVAIVTLGIPKRERLTTDAYAYK